MRQIISLGNRIGNTISTPLVSVLFFIICCNASADTSFRSTEPSYQKTAGLYQKNDCLTIEQVEYGLEVIKGLDYNAQRILRVFSTKFSPSFTEYQALWSVLINYPLKYEQVLFFEQWSRLPGIDQQLGLQAVKKIATLSHHAGLAFAALAELPDTTAPFLLTVIDLLNSFKDVVNQCLQSICLIHDMTARKITASFHLVSNLSTNQALAAHRYARINAIDSSTFFESLFHIGRLGQYDAWNFYTLLEKKGINKKMAWEYLIGFFALPLPLQQQQYEKLSDEQKKQLLLAMHTGGHLIIRRINNLHSITNRFGAEIPTKELQKFSISSLEKKFNELSIAIQDKNYSAVNQALKNKNKTKLISTLRTATAQERINIAANLTLANIYALMSRSGELFTSSYRNVLAPALQNHLENQYNGNLLQFVRVTDPGNILTAQFIAGCIQKGMLHTFFPQDPITQKKVLSKVCTSAFKNEQTTLLFSASLVPLFEILTPQNRNYFVRLMLDALENGEKSPAKLILIMLNYLIEYKKDLLDQHAIGQITRFKNQIQDINYKQQAPFIEWLSDGKLASLSIFHADDDGRQSFITFATMLAERGYALAGSDRYNKHILSPQQNAQLESMVEKKSNKKLPKLFSFMQKENGCISFTKIINGITIQHSISVYSSGENQYQRLSSFFSFKEEMLSQRGHSYWRNDQIIRPLEKIAKREPFFKEDRKQKLLLLGSCGGLQVYTQLYYTLNGSMDIFATIGTGFTKVNNSYTTLLLEIIAQQGRELSWDDIQKKLSPILHDEHQYVQPGSLTSLLHKEYLKNQL